MQQERSQDTHPHQPFAHVQLPVPSLSSHIHHTSKGNDSETKDFEIPHSLDRLLNIVSGWGRLTPESEGPHSRTTLPGQGSPGFATASHPQETAMDQTQIITESDNKTEGEPQTSFAKDYGKFNKVLHYEGFNTVELYEKKVPVVDETTSPAKFPQSHILERMRRTFITDTIKELYAVKVYRRHAKTTLSPPARPLQNQSRTVSLCHPNIVPIIDIVYNKQRNLCLVMPYYAGGTLHSLLSQDRKPSENLSTEELNCLTIQILRAVAFLHENDIVHGDLRPEHILLTAQGALKVGGFGEDEDAIRELAELSHNSNLTSSVPAPNPNSALESEDKPKLCIRRRVSESSVPYLPPERFSGLRGSRRQSYIHEDVSDLKPGDIWACGIICMLLRSGQFLWHSAQRVNPEKSFSNYLHDRLEEDGYGPIQVLENGRGLLQQRS
ncbi:kinase-like domain-containing protein [Penicillium cf. viridicatum]|uniref:Kinase-like domain-containing protein n=1 Tax=Penicillium cf. viridicatum TaxID=2972119 RepID=A0A9W9J4Z7_9EURO|nr:kinase-like domain-containing protein [Penicillium cf. viridicatum]